LLASAPNNANGITANGSTLLQLHAGRFDNGESLQQALQITRMLLDFRLPEGIKSRRILQQIQAFQTA
jgi:DNA repair protein recO